MIQLDQVGKRFENTVALKDVSLVIRGGSVHGLVGENGAGKSTLTGILAGAIAAYSGSITLGGRAHRPRSVSEAMKAGVGQVFQEVNLVPTLSVLENLLLGDLASFTRFGMIDSKRAKGRAEEVLDRVGLRLDPARPAGELDLGVQKLIEFARLLHFNPRVLILDELTVCLTDRQNSLLFDILRGLTAQGTTVLFVSHRMEEIRHICESATVLRDGMVVASVTPGDLTAGELASLTVGRTLSDDVMRYQAERKARQVGPVRMEVDGLGFNQSFRNVSFKVHKGEIVGLAGLENSGTEQVLESIYGVTPPQRGKIKLEGRTYTPRNPRRAIREGIGFVPKQREASGIINTLSVQSNILLSFLQETRCRWRSGRTNNRKLAERLAGELRIKCSDLDDPLLKLSGGNKQKVLFAKCLACRPGFLLMCHPTRGVDLGSKAEIYDLLFELARRGTSILLASPELLELIRLSDRILTMAAGEVTGEYSQRESPVSEEVLIRTMMLPCGDNRDFGDGNHE